MLLLAGLIGGFYGLRRLKTFPFEPLLHRMAFFPLKVASVSNQSYCPYRVKMDPFHRGKWTLLPAWRSTDISVAASHQTASFSLPYKDLFKEGQRPTYPSTPIGKGVRGVNPESVKRDQNCVGVDSQRARDEPHFAAQPFVLTIPCTIWASRVCWAGTSPLNAPRTLSDGLYAMDVVIGRGPVHGSGGRAPG